MLIQVIMFVPTVHFLRGGLTSRHSNNSHQTGQPISTTETANRNVSAVEKQKIGEGTIEPLTKAKLKVKSKCTVCSTEKPSKFCSNISSKISVKGRQQQFLGCWDKFGVNKTIREVISEGYKVPFISTTKNTFFPNNKSALTNKNFVDQDITELVDTGRVKEVENVLYNVNPLSFSERAISFD